MQNIIKFKVFSSVIIIALVLATVVIKVYPSDKDTSVIKIGGISALTGVGTSIGEEERRGALLAVEEINARGGVKDHPFQLISEDVSIDKIKNGISVARKLISVDNVVAIEGPQWDEPAVPMLPIIEDAKVPMVGADSSPMLKSEHDYKYFFSTWYDNKVGIRELLRFAEKKGLKKIAIIKPMAAGFWEYTADTFKKEASNYGVTVVSEVDMGNPIDLDFKTPLLRIKESNPDAIFVVTSDYNQCTFLKQAEQIGYKGVTLGTESSGDPVSVAECPILMEKRYFSTPTQSDNYKVFAEEFKSRFGAYPRFPSAATAYDAIKVIAKGLEMSNLKGGESLRDAIANIRGLKGTGLGDISFNASGFVNTPENAFEMQTVKDGQFVKVNY
jgi:branched-chain amino acid transport system substrate-binding protein